MNKTVSARIQHIIRIGTLAKNRGGDLSSDQVGSILKVIAILTFVTNDEYMNLTKQFKKFDSEDFIAELTQFLLKDLSWKKIADKRKIEFDELKNHYSETESRDFSINEYIYMLEKVINHSK